MNITFLGVGEACDEHYPNTSLLVSGVGRGGTGSVLLDCGFTVPSLYWQRNPKADDLDGIWLSHFHGDHFFGLPALLLRFWEMGRERPLTIISQAGARELTYDAMNMAYPGFVEKLTFPLHFMEMAEGREVRFLGCHWRSAATEHGQYCLAVRIDADDGSLFYSGDGRPTAATLNLARGCRLLVHEAFAVHALLVSGHGTVKGCIEFARSAGAERLALVHIQRQERQQRAEEIRELMDAVTDFEVSAPEPGTQWQS